LPPAPHATPRRRLAPWPAAVAAALVLAGCGSRPAGELPAAATPAASPMVSAEPAGRVVRSGGAAVAGRLEEGSGVRATAGGRTFEVLERENALRVTEEGREDGREVARLPTGLQPVAVTALGEDRQVAVLSARERVVELFDARTLKRIGRANAGTGPTRLVSNGENYVYVTDTTAGALLIFRLAGGEFRLDRRYRLAGAPYAIGYDSVKRRLWVTLTATNELVELSAGRRPRELRRFPSVRQPDVLAVASPGTGRVIVSSAAEDAVQLLDPPPLPSTR